MKSKIWLVLMVFLYQAGILFAQPNTLTILTDKGEYQISRHIYGHFAEHLGRCIYGGFWVGEDSSILNVRGIRSDVVQALKGINIPNLRWPGGCFADTYHWMDGIGPKSQRPTIINVHWGGVTEDNSFGTHEFMDLCGQLECEPIICGNVGSGTVQEMARWIEYLTSNNVSPMTNLRKQNGREEPWRVPFWGIGNENWGCGGNMRPEYYADVMRNFSTFCRNYGENRLYKIACGPNSNDYEWTEVLMKDGRTRRAMQGLSLHYYTVCHSWQKKGSATEFDQNEWYLTMKKTLFMEELITKHSEIMDKYDPRGRIGLLVDEWGNWHDVEPGTNPGFLYQQNTLRDALVAGINLNIFNNHCKRVKMANIAQTVNVLQSMILTKEEQLVLTPTYYVFEMLKVHQDGTLLPIELSGEYYNAGEDKIPLVTASASKSDQGNIYISFTNIHTEKELNLTCNLADLSQISSVSGRVLTANKMNAYNDFGKKEAVSPKEFREFKLKNNTLEIKLPSKSVVVLEVNI